MPALTLVTTCMGRLAHLRHSLPRLLAQDGAPCVVVDYGCPDVCGDWVQAHHPQVQVVRSGPVGHFSVGRARNLGASQVHTPWVGFVDADTLLDPGFLRRVLPLLREDAFFLAEPYGHELSGMVVCRIEDFRRIAGYDETFQGWGCEDRDLYQRLQRLGLRQLAFPAHGVTALAHDDAARTRHHAVADRFLSQRINGLYFQIKNDLARLTGKIDLAPADRQDLYDKVRERILADPQAPAEIEVTLPGHCDFTQPQGWRLRRTIRYRFEPWSPPTP